MMARWTAAAWVVLFPLLAGPSPAFGQRHATKFFDLPVASCPRADTLLGSAGGEPRSVRATGVPDHDTIWLHAGEWLRTLEASIEVNGHEASDAPDSRLYITLDGGDKRSVLAHPDSLRFRLALDDSLFDLGPPHPGVQLSPKAPIGFDVWIGPLTLLALVRAHKVEARLGGVPIKTGDKFQRSLRASYRIAVCGVPPGAGS